MKNTYIFLLLLMAFGIAPITNAQTVPADINFFTTEGYVNNKEELTVTGFENEIKKIKSTDPKEIIEHVSDILTKDLNELRDDITCLGIHLPN